MTVVGGGNQVTCYLQQPTEGSGFDSGSASDAYEVVLQS